MFRMTQRETAFFDVFEAAARIAHESAMLLEELVVSFENPDEKIKALEVKEREGDQQVHAMMDRLNRSFITPMDREDLFHISKELDDITDCIETTAHLFAMFDVRIVKPEAVAFVKLIVEATAELRGVILEMKSFKKNRALKTKVI